MAFADIDENSKVCDSYVALDLTVACVPSSGGSVSGQR